MAARSHKNRRKRKHKDSGIPFASGFYLPTEKRTKKALGITELEKEYEIGEEGEFFGSLPRPTSIDDWLAQYNEEGQSFKSFLATCPWLSAKSGKYIKQRFVSDGKNIKEKYPDGKIYLQPLGEFDSETSPSIVELAKYAELFYTLPIVVLPKVRLDIPIEKDGPVCWLGPEEHDRRSYTCSIECELNSKRRKSSRLQIKSHVLDHRWHNKGKMQLKVGGVLKLLHENSPPDALCLIGLTMADLYEEEPDLFVAGMAAGIHRVAVFSFARYDPNLTFSTEFWYEIQQTNEHSEDERKSVMLQRSCKLLVHELAHLFGVDHCIWYSCCMNGSGHLQEDFSQPIHLCPIDLHKLRQLCGFDIVNRYNGAIWLQIFSTDKEQHKEQLMMFFRKHGMDSEGEWIARRLRFIAGADS